MVKHLTAFIGTPERRTGTVTIARLREGASSASPTRLILKSNLRTWSVSSGRNKYVRSIRVYRHTYRVNETPVRDPQLTLAADHVNVDLARTVTSKLRAREGLRWTQHSGL